MVFAQATDGGLKGAVLSRRWRLLDRIGGGGMGEVYAAEALGGGPHVAIKLLRAEYLSDSGVMARFLEEATTCMRLRHPNIVRVTECAAAEDATPYLVMELLEGVPLGAYLERGNRVPVERAVPILQGVLAGLAAAHAEGIVHRDLKPDNVFLTRGTDGLFVVKLLDFGIAKVMDSAGGQVARTRTGMLLGTPAYMSPEQVKCARDVDERSDIWSAGVMFYEMLTGRPAFPAVSEYARLTAVLSAEPDPPIERFDPALAVFAPFLARALRKSREERFSSAFEMDRALVACAPQAAVSSTGPQGSAEGRREASNRPAEGLGAGAAGASLAPALPFAQVPPVGDTLASPLTPREPRDPPPVLAVKPGLEGTGAPILPRDDPRAGRRGHGFARGARGMWVVLVGIAFVAGVALGFVLGRVL